MTVDSLYHSSTRSSLDEIRHTMKHGLPVHRYGSVHSVHQVVFGRTPEVLLWQNTRTFSSLTKANSYLHHA